MGLDVYFLRKPVNRRVVKPSEDIISGLHCLCQNNKELSIAIEDLYTYASDNKIDFTECLKDTIENFLSRNSPSYNSEKDGEEVVYFRKLWWIMDHFNYRDDDYGKDVEITKSQIEDLVTMSKKLILMVIKHFTDKGFEIESSPIDYEGDTIRWGGNRSDYLTFKNAILTDSMVEEADEICSEAIHSDDDFLFYKICEMYIQFSRALNTTDFEKEKIYMNADW